MSGGYAAVLENEAFSETGLGYAFEDIDFRRCASGLTHWNLIPTVES